MSLGLPRLAVCWNTIFFSSARCGYRRALSAITLTFATIPAENVNLMVARARPCSKLFSCFGGPEKLSWLALSKILWAVGRFVLGKPGGVLPEITPSGPCFNIPDTSQGLQILGAMLQQCVKSCLVLHWSLVKPSCHFNLISLPKPPPRKDSSTPVTLTNA